MIETLQRAAGLLQAGRLADAVDLLDKVLLATPGQADALMLRAMARSRAGDDPGACADFAAAADSHSQPAVVHNNFGNHHGRAGRSGAAVDAYRRAIELAPDYFDARLNLALTLSGGDDFDAAEAALDDVLALRPGHAGALNALGNLARRRGDDVAAERAFTAAIASDDRAVLPRINRGALLREAGRLAEACTDLEQACQLAPGMAEAHAQLGHSLRTRLDIAGAERAYRQALSLAPFDAGYHADLASLLFEAGQGASALDSLKQAITASGDPQLNALLARLLMRSGDAVAARAAADAALARDPAAVAAAMVRSELSLRTGDAAAALVDARRAFAMSEGQDWAARHGLAEALLVNSAWAEAVDVLTVDPPAEHLQKHLALQSVAWRQTGDARYARLCDYDRFARKMPITPPPGYASLADFNEALAERIEALHADGAAPLEQTLYGGTQSAGRLWNSDDPVIRELAMALQDLSRKYLAELPEDPDHPFLARNTGRARLAGAWSVRLRSGGGHVDHVHPAGWVSASYYVKIPKRVLDGERDGWLRLGVPGLPGLALPAERYILPEPGHAIFFPSFFWHGVEPFQGDELRITAPFDLLPDP
ncbi:tetratricopeptide repeat protein [Maricaulis maris]|uniref:Tfp pilus assembly protein PilF n=1 Tax=Maricaulis maris TaxID=74318 RepID=A0A495DKS7_9PROT|nr:putative 2OG-Fe(II) oxygenase [Maricaulis maris]RKR03213.1 Tfp pilus assembly protein PilF [Maricaulis maris]